MKITGQICILTNLISPSYLLGTTYFTSNNRYEFCNRGKKKTIPEANKPNVIAVGNIKHIKDNLIQIY
ncbi:hypothetical protein J5U21_01931 [Saccharolobus shibatae]|uniref:Uncharacterized protein n=1 Tax=Saccharolobus shibatae TaxID=2286 RepID=A0A8F5GWQ6_9CREN|nr:hypothetical protein J5U21_01931 [Saccharolobus shibatae]